MYVTYNFSFLNLNKYVDSPIRINILLKMMNN